MRSLQALALIGALAVFSPAAAQTVSDMPRLSQALAADGQCPGVLVEADTLARSPAFAALPRDDKSAFLVALLRCAWVANDDAVATRTADAANALGLAWAPQLQIDTALQFNHVERALDLFTALAASAPARARRLEKDTVQNLINAARRIDPSNARLIAVYDGLAAAGYAPDNRYAADAMWFAHAKLLIAAGRTADARARLAAVLDPRLLLYVRVSKAFDPVRGDPALEAHLDLTAAAEAALARARAAQSANPPLIEPVIDIARQLRALGRSQEAVNELQALLRRADSPQGPSLFDDHAERVVWALDQLGYALYETGRARDGRAAFQRAIAISGGLGVNVSQAINLAHLLYLEGRSSEALALADTAGLLSSDYGLLYVMSVRVCATRDRQQRTFSLSYLREHESDNPKAVAQALLCVGDLDGVAQLYVRRLGNPEQRDEALAALQIYPPDLTGLERYADLAQRLAAVRDRPDVKAAIEAAGRIETIPLHPVFWGDL